MQIKRFAVSNFRSFDQNGVSFSFEKGLNVLIGENNSGKTNTLLAYDSMLNLIPSDDGNLKQSDLRDFHNSITDNPIRFSFSAILNDVDIDYLMDRLKAPSSFKADFLSICGNELTMEILYYLDLPLNKIEIHIGKLQIIGPSQCRLEGSDNNPTKESVKWSDLVKNAKSKDNLIKLQGNEHQNKIINFEMNLYRIIKDLLSITILYLPEFREKPKSSELGLLISPTGKDLPAVLHNLRGNMDIHDRSKWKEIQRMFSDQFPYLTIDVTNSRNIVFIDENQHQVSHESVGAGILEFLIILAHLTGQEDRVFIIDEPEQHLHPHAKRALSSLLKRFSEKNQIISITHSTHFVDSESIKKVNLMSRIKGKSILTTASKYHGEGKIQRLLQRTMRSEQKEFLFSKFVLLVEGETEFGVIPILSKKIGFDLDISGVSIISVNNKHFAYYIELIQYFGIPYTVMCDLDAIINIESTINIKDKKIRTSQLIKQLYDLKKIDEDHKTDNDYQKMVKLDASDEQLILKQEKKIVENKKKRYPTSMDILSRLKSSSNLSDEQKTWVEKIEREIAGTKQPIYDDSSHNELKNIAKKNNIIVLSSDFEGIFRKVGLDNLYKRSRVVFPNSKVLQGKYIAQQVKKNNIPKEIKDILSLIESYQKMSER